jgi:hypothetical protein
MQQTRKSQAKGKINSGTVNETSKSDTLCDLKNVGWIHAGGGTADSPSLLWDLIYKTQEGRIYCFAKREEQKKSRQRRDSILFKSIPSGFKSARGHAPE